MESLYDRDFYKWTQKNAQLLREGRFSEIDLENLIEELEAMGRSEKRALISRLAVLIAHLLKWEYQPQTRSKSLGYTIKEQRRRATSDLLEDNPSFKRSLDDMLSKAHQDALLMVLKETPLDEADLPVLCPYTTEQVMDNDFWPE